MCVGFRVERSRFRFGCARRKTFEQTFHDLLWVLALLVGGDPPRKNWGLVYQFICVYRLGLMEAKILKLDNTIAVPPAEGGHGLTASATGKETAALEHIRSLGPVDKVDSQIS
jgi:hypothetical protein